LPHSIIVKLNARILPAGTKTKQVKRLIARLFNWERWPFFWIYFPISFIWAWYCIRSRSFWFFSSSNPTLTFGGFEGESKREMYEQLPKELYPATIYIDANAPFDQVKTQVEAGGFSYPFIVKPDIGMKGILFRKIDNEKQLQEYHHHIPVDYLAQELVEYPVELSVFYYRYPGEKKGTISGFIEKELLQVEGDGRSTLWDLIQNHPRAKFRLEEMRQRHLNRLEEVLPEAKKFYLSYAGNHNRGARFINLTHEVDDQLREVFDKLSEKADKFYYGRYDVKCSSVDELKQGKKFTILEFNGAGAEPNHIYDAGLTLHQAHMEILKHWKVLFEISRINHKNGYRYWPFLKGWKFLRKSKKHFKMLEEYD
jgi:hypothetical protein